MYITNRTDKFIFYFIIIDILFLPYNPYVATSNSIILLPLWFCLRKGYLQLIDSSEWFIFKIFIFFSFIGTLISYFTLPNEYFQEGITENIKRFLSLNFAILYYFYFQIIFKSPKISFNISKWLVIFIFYIFLWALLYYIDFNLFLTLKTAFNRFDSFIQLYKEVDNFYRFSFIWSDPNNIAYAVVGCYSFLLLNCKPNIIVVSLLTLIIIFINILSQSTGGWLAFGTVGLFSLFLYLKSDLVSKFSFKKILFYSIILISILIILPKIVNIINTDQLFQQSFDRTATKAEDPRSLVWSKLFEDKVDYLGGYFIFGSGYQVYVNNHPFNVHSGHILLFFAFGLGGYLSFMRLFFVKSKLVTYNQILFIIPFFLCFTINTMIGELKLLVFYFLLVASIRFNSA
jgi:hypothetical protein